MGDIGKIELYDLGTGAWIEASQRTWLTITSKDLNTLLSTFVVMILLLMVGWLIGRNPRLIPSYPQLFLEFIIGFVDDLCKESLGKELGRTFTSFIGTLFVFLLLCNYIGVVGFEEPTLDINLPLGLGILGFGIAVYQAMRFKGFFGYFWELLMEPIPIIMFPLNVIGELSKIVSISFRLFGNIMGGAVIIQVVSWLVGYIVLPIGLYGFFGIFVGTIQAFVFTMLTLAYIAQGVELGEEDEEEGQLT